MLRKPRRSQLLAQAGGGDHGARPGAVEAAHPGVDRPHRQAHARLDVFGETRVEGGGERQPRRRAQLRAARPSGPSVAMCSASGRTPRSCGPAAAAAAATARCPDRSGRGMVRNRSGPITSTTWPMARSSSTTVVSVRTTPFTCGAQASVTIMMRCEGAGGSIGAPQQASRAIASGSLRHPARAARRTTAGSVPPNRSVPAARHDVPPGRCSFPPSRRRSDTARRRPRASRRGGCGRRPRRRSRGGAPRWPARVSNRSIAFTASFTWRFSQADSDQ